MEKEINTLNNISHGITLIERKSVILTGIKKIESFDDEEFLVETIMGYLVIKGENLELLKLDTLQGNVSIKGFVKSLSYIEENKAVEKETSIISRLFK